MPRRSVPNAPSDPSMGPGHRPVPRTDPSEGLLEACQRAVNRVLAELSDRDRQVLEAHRARVVALTHRETRAALEEIRGVLHRVA